MTLATLDKLMNKTEQAKMIRVVLKPEYENYHFSQKLSSDSEEISITKKITYINGRESNSQLEGFLHLDEAILHFDKPISPQYTNTIKYDAGDIHISIDTIRMIFREK